MKYLRLLFFSLHLSPLTKKFLSNTALITVTTWEIGTGKKFAIGSTFYLKTAN